MTFGDLPLVDELSVTVQRLQNAIPLKWHIKATLTLLNYEYMIIGSN